MGKMMIDQDLMPQEIVRKKRKSISLVIDFHGNLIVKAPLRCSEERIYQFIQSKAHWIRSKKAQIKKRDIYSPLALQSGERIVLLGKTFVFEKVDIKKISTEEGRILLPLDVTNKDFVAYMKKLAKRYFDIRVPELASAFGFKYRGISISKARTYWGSCTSENKLNLSYKLIMCPLEVIDYIIIHELTHTIYKNHSKDFWQHVESILPDYKRRNKWLKDNRAIIDVI